MTGNSGRKKGGGPYMPGVAFVPTPYCYRCFAETTPDKCDMLCARRVGEVARLHLSGSVCAFIAEPVMGEGGIIVPPDDYFKRVKEILDEEGILFIADEVQSGFGRTGKMFAIEHYGVDPGHHDHGQGHRRRLAAQRLHRPAGDRRRLPDRRPPQHLRRQPRELRRRARQHRVPHGRRRGRRGAQGRRR